MNRPDWPIVRLRHVATVNPPDNGWRSLPEGTEATFLPMDKLGECGGIDATAVMPAAAIAGFTSFAENDTLVAKITPSFENGKGALASGLANGMGFGTTELHVIRPGKRLDPRYLALLSYSPAFRLPGPSRMKGVAGQKRISDDYLRDFEFALPPLPVQKRIVEHFSSEAAHIDTLIDRKQRFIDLLLEKRTAVITQAVTKGLDPTVEMKDTGVEWLDRYPACWRLQALKHYGSKTTVGIVVTPAKYYLDEGVPSLRSFNIASGLVDAREMAYISAEGNRVNAKSILRASDIVVVRTGKAGVAAIVPPEMDGANCIDLLIVRKSPQLDTKYLWYFLSSRAAAEQVALYSVGSIQAHYNTGTLANMQVTAPLVEEQRRIARYLDEQTAHIDDLTAATRRSIDLLREYRTALISAAVTGQIDIPGAETAEEVA